MHGTGAELLAAAVVEAAVTCGSKCGRDAKSGWSAASGKETGYRRDVEEVYLGSGGVLAATASGSMVIDMTTSEPALAKRLHDQAAQRGVACLEEPVSGGDTGARAGTVAIMVGGDRADYDRAMPYFDRASSRTTSSPDSSSSSSQGHGHRPG